MKKATDNTFLMLFRRNDGKIGVAAESKDEVMKSVVGLVGWASQEPGLPDEDRRLAQALWMICQGHAEAAEGDSPALDALLLDCMTTLGGAAGQGREGAAAFLGRLWGAMAMGAVGAGVSRIDWLKTAAFAYDNAAAERLPRGH